MKSKLDLTNFDVIGYLQSRGVPYKTHGDNVSSGWVGIQCLFCIDHDVHLGINLQTTVFNCYKCAETGNAYKLIKTIEGISSFEKIKNIIKEFEGNSFIPREKHYQSKVMFPLGTTKQFPEKHLKFLESRRYDPEVVIKKYDLYATGPIGDYKHRIIIPVFFKNRLMSFVARDVTRNAGIPYRNSSDQYSIREVKQLLYNLDNVIQDRAIIVEGIFDAWRIGDGAICTFGTKYTREQLRLLKGLKRAFILFDQDAIHLAHKMAYDLSAFVPQIEVLELSEGDPDNLSDDDVRHLRREIGI